MKKIVLFAFCTILFASCGKKATVKSLVSDFMEQNMVDASLYDLKIGKIDSTRFLSADKINELRKLNGPEGLYKKNVKYTEGGIPRTLTYVNVMLIKDGEQRDTVKQTFYLDQELTRVIAMK